MKNILLLFFLLPSAVYSQSKVTSGYVDSLVERSMKMFPQAAVGIAVIQDGKITHQKGYGIISADTKEKADENTLFCIASNSKAFTSTALGMLVDQGKLKWEDKVIDYIPEFRMYDDYITANFNILDLLTHRSGLGLGAGDLMFFPDGNNFTIDDVIKSFQYQTPVSAFRTKYDYDNLLYIVAGEIIHRVSGKPWDKFVQDEIMKKLEMKNSAGLYTNISTSKNIAVPHKTENGKIQTIDPYINDGGSIGAAGGIYSSVADMSQWVLMHLNEGKYGAEKKETLISKENHDVLWKIHTSTRYSAKAMGMYQNHYKGYGLGFFLEDQMNYTIVQHSGGLPGMLSMVTIIPELNAAVIVLTNTDPGGLGLITFTNEIKDKLIGAPDMDWLDWADKRLAESSSHADSVINAVWKQVELSKKTKIDFKNFVGKYKDDWFGEVEVYEKDTRLMIKCVRSPKLSGEMKFYQANTFAVAWDYQDMECDAFVMFQLDENGKAKGMTMKGISPNIDFSFDFHDLDLKRVEE